MTERKGQIRWLRTFFKDWPKADVSRRMDAARAFHKQILHSEEAGNVNGFIKDIIEIKLDEVTLARLRKDHSSQPSHKFVKNSY